MDMDADAQRLIEQLKEQLRQQTADFAQFKQMMEAKFQGVRALALKVQSSVEGMYITGQGFSGVGPQGIMFNPIALPPGPKGETGAAGPAITLTIGTVTTGSPSSATITGGPTDYVLNLVLEKGPQGDQGDTFDPGTLSSTTIHYLDCESVCQEAEVLIPTPPPP